VEIAVKITLLPSTYSAAGAPSDQYLTTYLVNDCIAIDAGSLGFCQSPQEQAAVRHVFLSHTHMDHVASLPIFLENVAGLADMPVMLHASEAVQECLRNDLFAGRLWANFLELTHEGGPFVILRTLEEGQPVEVEGVRITPIAVHHVVPTLGFILEDERSAVVIASDTGPTEAIWARARQTSNLKAAFLEATFPNDHQRLADITLHLTPADFLREMQKLPEQTIFLAVHLKARFRPQVMRELADLHRPNLRIAQIGTTYEF
jgi:ribonuclease BN (tRNA processing enzyme)